MNRPSSRSAFAAFTVVFMIAACPAIAQPVQKQREKAIITPDVPQSNFRRNIFSGKESSVAQMHYVNMDCTSGPLPDIRVVTPPSSGGLRFDQIKYAVNRKQGNSRFHCNGKIVDAVSVFYKARDGYTGPDKIVIDVDFKDGNVSRFSYSIEVR